MQELVGKKIIIGVTGGIAAYKTADLVSQLVQMGNYVKVVMTNSAQHFVTATTFQALTGEPVRDSLWDNAAEAAMGHIELAKWADLIVIAPASADIIARLNHGMANDLLTTLCLATPAPIALVPAMNQQMWHNAIVQKNIHSLQSTGVMLWGPAQGRQACGDVGYGRMLETDDIIQHVSKAFSVSHLLAGKRVVITAGPTREFVDAVRFLSNRSSGKMGYALAAAALQLGADVTLISGPVDLSPPMLANYIPTVSADEMHQAAITHAENADIFIASAAVSDVRPTAKVAEKIAKQDLNNSLHLTTNKDIVADVSTLVARPFVVGFAAETHDLVDKANNKLINKKLDMIIANRVDAPDIGFDSDDNAVTVLSANGQQPIAFEKTSKVILAKQLMTLITENYYATKNSA